MVSFSLLFIPLFFFLFHCRTTIAASRAIRGRRAGETMLRKFTPSRVNYRKFLRPLLKKMRFAPQVGNLWELDNFSLSKRAAIFSNAVTRKSSAPAETRRGRGERSRERERERVAKQQRNMKSKFRNATNSAAVFVFLHPAILRCLASLPFPIPTCTLKFTIYVRMYVRCGSLYNIFPRRKRLKVT